MKIAVVCANGRVGRLVVKEAINRGLDVTAIAKGENQTVAEKYICKDLFDLTAADVAAYDVVVDAFGAWAEDLLPLLREGRQAVVQYRQLQGSLQGAAGEPLHPDQRFLSHLSVDSSQRQGCLCGR